MTSPPLVRSPRPAGASAGIVNEGVPLALGILYPARSSYMDSYQPLFVSRLSGWVGTHRQRVALYRHYRDACVDTQTNPLMISDATTPHELMQHLIDTHARSSMIGLDLSQLNLKRVNWPRMTLSDVTLMNSHLDHANLEGANLARSSLLGARLNGANLLNATLTHTVLTGATLVGTSLQGAQMTGVNLSGAQLSRATLREAQLYRATLSGACLVDTDMRQIELTNANLTATQLMRSNLTGARLTGAILSGADLTDATCSRAVACHAKLPGAVLTRADLRGADFRWAHFQGAHLGGSNWEGAQLNGARFYGATVTGATFGGGDLSLSSLLDLLHETRGVPKLDGMMILNATEDERNAYLAFDHDHTVVWPLAMLDYSVLTTLSELYALRNETAGKVMVEVVPSCGVPRLESICVGVMLQKKVSFLSPPQPSPEGRE